MIPTVTAARVWPSRREVDSNPPAAAAIAIGVFLAFGEYTRRSRVAGQLVPDLGLSTVVAPTSGIVDRIYPREGQRVLVGAPLALVATPRATQSGADARSSIDEGIQRRRASLRASARSQAALLATREAGLRAQLTAIQREMARLQDQLGNRTRQVALGKQTLERYRTLSQQRYLSALQLVQQEQVLLDLVSGQQGLQRQLAALQTAATLKRIRSRGYSI